MTAQLDMFEAVRERNARLDSLIADPKNDRHRQAVLEAIRDHVAVGERFTANTIRGYLPYWVRTPVIGAVFMVLSRRRITTFEGLTVSTDRGTHAKRIGIWRLNQDPS